MIFCSSSKLALTFTVDVVAPCEVVESIKANASSHLKSCEILKFSRLSNI
jgi:hypothetical protein